MRNDAAEALHCNQQQRRTRTQVVVEETPTENTVFSVAADRNKHCSTRQVVTIKNHAWANPPAVEKS
jgi:hypothetical protein